MENTSENKETDKFFENPILNSPYEMPAKYWETDENNKPTGKIISGRRPAGSHSPIASPQNPGEAEEQNFLEAMGLAGEEDIQYKLVKQIRREVDAWRAKPDEKDWHVTAQTATLLKHWRTFDFPMIRPFFCQIEAVETLIWLTEAASSSAAGKEILEQLRYRSAGANSNLMRIALKLATGAGKTTVMAMIIAWQTINAVYHGQSAKFTKGFLVCAPGLTIRDRLQVLKPNDPGSYYASRQLVPREFLSVLSQARIVITNFHAFLLRDTAELSKNTRTLLLGDNADDLFRETPSQMLERVCPELLQLKNVLVINDEAHHCYQHNQKEEEEKVGQLEREEAKKNTDNARVWISGLQALKEKVAALRVVDLSATPFFLRGSGYKEGTLFPWTVSDFSLMDALECGIVKLPRIPVNDNLSKEQREQMPMYRSLWRHIGKDMLALSRRAEGTASPSDLPNLLKTAVTLLYNNYEKVFESWRDVGNKTPPCFIFVCQNTRISKLVYDYVSGYVVKTESGDENVIPGACELFSNFDENKNRLAMPRTLLIDSVALENADSIDKAFLNVSQEAIQAFKNELIARDGNREKADKLDAVTIMREILNTVGKEGKLGEQVRCVVSVSMLAEGWDANTVTHILGVRAFGTQLLCEQVVGRALRRLSYEADQETKLYKPEYADIFGIPFDFTSAGSKVTPPTPPPDIVRVHAVRPERDDLAISFPNVDGYYIQCDAQTIDINPVFDSTSRLKLNKEVVGATFTQTSGGIGAKEDFTIGPPKLRASTVIMKLAERFVEKYYREKTYSVDKTQFFVSVKNLFHQWIAKEYVSYEDDLNHDALIRYSGITDQACEIMNRAIVKGHEEESKDGSSGLRALIDSYQPSLSTANVNFVVSKSSKTIIETNPLKSHISHCVLDSMWEAICMEVIERHPRTLAYARNYHLGLYIPYTFQGKRHDYEPDFIVKVDDGRGVDDPLCLIVEVKGHRYPNADVKKATARDYWVPSVNNLKEYGRWAFIELNEEHFIMEGDEREKKELSCRTAYNDAITKLVDEASAETSKTI